jgi:protein gp37
MMSDRYWQKPLKWNRDAERSGVPARVFCASMADVFEDHPHVVDARARLWQLIEQTPWLRWQLLTKRPQNITGMAPWGNRWPGHVWIGTSVEDQQRADERIPILLEVDAAVRFLSCEPLLDMLDLKPYLTPGRDVTEANPDAPDRSITRGREGGCGTWERSAPLQWVIAGGESGPQARPMDPAWPRRLRDQCAAAGTDFFFKQWGEYAPSGRIVIRSRPVPGSILVGGPVDELGHRVEMIRHGKKRAGRLLDGRLHGASPPLTMP